MRVRVRVRDRVRVRVRRQRATALAEQQLAQTAQQRLLARRQRAAAAGRRGLVGARRGGGREQQLLRLGVAAHHGAQHTAAHPRRHLLRAVGGHPRLGRVEQCAQGERGQRRRVGGGGPAHRGTRRERGGECTLRGGTLRAVQVAAHEAQRAVLVE